MKVETIEQKGNFVTCTIGGVKLQGTKDYINTVLAMNGLPKLNLEPMHYSTTKDKYMPIKEMAVRHIENHLMKETVIDDYLISYIRDNDDNLRDYLRALIAGYDNYEDK